MAKTVRASRIRLRLRYADPGPNRERAEDAAGMEAGFARLQAPEWVARGHRRAQGPVRRYSVGKRAKGHQRSTGSRPRKGRYKSSA